MAPDPNDPGDPLGEGPLGEGVLGPEPEVVEEGAAPAEGWRSQSNKSARRNASFALIAVGLISVLIPPAEAPQETPQGWLQALSTAPKRPNVPFVRASQEWLTGSQPSNNVDGLVSGGSDAIFTRTLYYSDFSTYPPQPPTVQDNTGTVDTWLVRWQGPPRYLPPKLIAQPFVPHEAVLENTITPDKWLRPFGAPPRYWPIKVQAFPFVPKEAVLENTVQPDKWLMRWQGPPRYLFSLPGGQPFIPKEAVLENTVDQGWRTPFIPAPPPIRPRPTQPVFGYPYAFASNLTTSIEWLAQWKGPPRYQPPKILAQPFIPKEAVLENTVTPDKWWQQLGKIAVRYLPPARPAQPLVPREATIENTVTPDKWHQPFARRPVFMHPRFADVIYTAQPPVFVENTVTIDKWLVPLGQTPKKPQWMAARGYLQWPHQLIIQIPSTIVRPTNRIITFMHESRTITFKRSSRIITFLKQNRTVS